MRDFMKSCDKSYLEVTGATLKSLRHVEAAFLTMPCGGATPPDPDKPEDYGELSDIACSVLMKLLYAARLARWDLLRAIGILSSRITKWTPFCDKALHRLMCCVNSSVEQTLIGYVGQEDTIDDFALHAYADADLAGDRPSYKSTAGSYAEIAGPRTVFPSAARSKNITGTCSSTPEAEMASANMAYKAVGAPTLDLLDLICERKVHMIMFEDNTATIEIIKTGKNLTMRHLLRHQGINIRVLHETFYPRDPDTFEL